MSSQLYQAIQHVCDEKNVPMETVVKTIEAAMAAAYRKDYGLPNQNIRVEFDPETGATKVFDVKTVMEKPPEEEENTNTVEEPASPSAKRSSDTTVSDSSAGAPTNSSGDSSSEESEKPRFHPRLHMTPEEAQIHKPGAQIGDEIRIPLDPPSDYGRMAAQTAKQVITQKLKEAERLAVYEEYKDKEKTIVQGTVQRKEGRMVFVDVGRTAALVPPEEQVPTESYSSGARLKFLLAEVRADAKGPSIILSRARPEFVKKLFEIEIPEVQHGTVEIVSIAREAGSRSKVAVRSTQENIDPIGSCVGQRGTRIQTIIQEIGGEKIDIIHYNDDPTVYIKNALSPAKVVTMTVSPEHHHATVKVNEDQLSLAIGRGGQNVRLATRLTGWKIDIRPADEEVTTEEQPVSEQQVMNANTANESASPAETNESKEEPTEENPKS